MREGNKGHFTRSTCSLSINRPGLHAASQLPWHSVESAHSEPRPLVVETNSVCRIMTVSCVKGGRVMIAFFVNYSTVAFPLHLPTLKRQQFFGAVANSLGKNSYFPLPLDVRRCVAPTGEEVDARQRGVN